MSKLIKIILSVLFIASVSGSVLYYFDLLPFIKKTNFGITGNSFKEASLTTTPTEKSFLSCIILDEQFCNQGKPIYDSSNQLVGLGFKLPVGSKVYSPFKGQIEKSTTFQLNGKGYPSIDLMDISKDDWGLSPTRTYFSIVGYFQEEIADEIVEIEEKRQVVELSDMVVDESLGDYNLIINFTKYNLEGNKWGNDINLLKQFFNYVEEK